MKINTTLSSLALLSLVAVSNAIAGAGDPLPVQIANMDAQSATLEAKVGSSNDKLSLHFDQHEEIEELVEGYASLLVEARRLAVEALLMADAFAAPPSLRGSRASNPVRGLRPTLLFGGDPGEAPDRDDDPDDEHGHGETEGLDLGDLDFVLFVVEEAIHSSEDSGLDRDFETAEELLHEAEEAREEGEALTALRLAAEAYRTIACTQPFSGRPGR